MGPLVKSALVGLGAVVGANGRYWIGVAFDGRAKLFPWDTLLINVTGSLLLGSFVALSARQGWSESWRLLIAVGLCGGYTTFSTFSLETLRLMDSGNWLRGCGYALVSAIFSISACFLGMLAFGKR